uniref:ATP-binding cassette domain-containing protein n=1 Tax=Thermus caliditerrae TaxID=1330700 RepID=A0A7C5VGD2_9DEIN
MGKGVPLEGVIEATDLARAFGRVWALKGFSFRIAPGDQVVLLGPNGAGKTTLVDICFLGPAGFGLYLGRGGGGLGVSPQRGRAGWGPGCRLVGHGCLGQPKYPVVACATTGAPKRL